MASTELTGGTGFTFEDAVAAYYLACLLAGVTAPGLRGHRVQRVALQQASTGEPLDDIVVDAASGPGEEMRLSLQVKRSLRVSGAESNVDFREVVQLSWQTLEGARFRRDIDRVGAVVGTISSASFRNFATVCEWARASETPASFMHRFGEKGGAANGHRSVLESVRQATLADSTGLSDEDLHKFFSHFVLVQLDLLHEGSVDEAKALEILQQAIADVHQAVNLWHRLRQMTRSGSGVREEFSRGSVLRRLDGAFRLRGTPAFAGDIEALREATHQWLAQQPRDISGTHLERPELREKLEEAISKRRLTLVKGLPGTGKTVLLRDAVARRADEGTVIVLAANRLAGASWAEHASSIGLTSTAIEPLLVEVAATGFGLLFIDGLDRIAPERRGVVSDLLAQLVSEPTLSQWRVVATARDLGIEPLRNWMPSALMSSEGVGYVDVENLSDSEASKLADALPVLRSLLLGGDERVRDLARRPFFASVLAGGLSSATYPNEFVPRSEVDLVHAWWARGGYDAAASHVLQRQRALIDLAELGVGDLGRNIKIRDLTAATRDALTSLQVDGLLQQVRPGLTVQFSHDIFFEWSLFYTLLDNGDAWIEHLVRAGEPPALARVVELLSQATFPDQPSWIRNLRSLDSPSLRPQWLRAWLLAATSSPTFDEHAASFATTVDANQFSLLKKLFVWMLAEKSTPNPLVLSGFLGAPSLQPRDRLRFADALGWPSDFAAWRRLILWALGRIDSIPDDCLPDLISLFDSWQVAFSEVPNPLSARIIHLSDTWLRAIDAEHQLSSLHLSVQPPAPVPGPRAPFEIESRLRALVLGAARSYPDVVTENLRRFANRKDIRDEAFRELISWSKLLSQTHPQQLADIARQHFVEELPEDQRAREREEAKARARRADKIRAKPEDERSKEEKRYLQHLPFSLPSSGASSRWDLERLAIGGDYQGYFPASPLREPFHSLLEHAPSVGLQLVRDLANHATMAWRQYHREPGQRMIPFPLNLDFPWGRQEFWGTAQHYVWSRGHGGPQVMESAMMALESWAIEQLEAKRPASEVMRDVVEGHANVAVLGIAMLLSKHAGEVSPVSLPLVGSLRLWRWDIYRAAQEQELSQAAIQGFEDREAVHRDAVIRLNKLPTRQQDVRLLAVQFMLNKDLDLRTACANAIRSFPERLEPEYERQARDAAYMKGLREQAEMWAAHADRKNYVRSEVPGRPGLVSINVVSPRENASDVVEARAKIATLARELELWQWVEQSFRGTGVASTLTVDEAVERAKEMWMARGEGTSGVSEPGNVTFNGSIAGTAAVLLCFDERGPHAKWAEEVIAMYLVEREDMEDGTSRRSRLPWHPKIFVAKVLVARLRREPENEDLRRSLLKLVTHPLFVVALEALSGILSCWRESPTFAWAAMNLGLRLSIIKDPARRRSGDAEAWRLAEVKRRQLALDSAILDISAPPFPDLVVPAPFWKKTTTKRGGPRGEDEWQESDDIWDDEFAGEVLQLAPLESLKSTAPAREKYVNGLEAYLAWTLDALNPNWRTRTGGRRGRESTRLIGWEAHVGRLLALAFLAGGGRLQTRLLKPVLSQPSEVGWGILASFTSLLVAAGVLDAKQIEPDVVNALSAIADRVTAHADLQRDRSDGRIGGFDLPKLIKNLLFVDILEANGAIRFANGKWTDIHQVIPVVDVVVRRAGWTPFVAAQFITLCTHAGTDYPAVTFADQILAQLQNGRLPEGWKGTTVPASISDVVQVHADHHHPLPLDLARKLLRILDALVEMGDRRSAALQQSEAFRGVRLP